MALFGRKKPSQTPQVAEEAEFVVEELPRQIEGEVVDEYDVGKAHVVIADDNGKGKYIVVEPELTDIDRTTYSIVMENLYYSLGGVEYVDDPAQYIRTFMERAAQELALTEELKASRERIEYYLLRDFNGYGVIDVLVRDPEVEEISCEGFGKPVAVIQRKHTEYDWLDTNIVFESEEDLSRFVQKLAHKAGKNVTTATPFADAIMKEGHRLAVTFSNEVTLPGSTFDIRKFPSEPLSIAHLLKYNTMSPLMAAYYWVLVENKAFILVIGPMSSGKTTGINALASMISPNMKICTIEDTPELVLPHTHWERMKSRQAYSITESKFDIDLHALTKLSLRYRPDYIIVGEARGEEISALVQAAAVGHGCISSLHGDSPEAALVRMSSPPMNVQVGGQMLIWNLLLMNRVRDEHGKIIRRAISSTEVTSFEDKIKLVEIFTWDAKTDTFSPNNAREVVKKSRRLKSVMRLLGWDEDTMVAELERRAAFLEGLVKEEKLKYSEVSKELTRFYTETRLGMLRQEIKLVAKKGKKVTEDQEGAMQEPEPVTDITGGEPVSGSTPV